MRTCGQGRGGQPSAAISIEPVHCVEQWGVNLSPPHLRRRGEAAQDHPEGKHTVHLRSGSDQTRVSRRVGGAYQLRRVVQLLSLHGVVGVSETAPRLAGAGLTEALGKLQSVQSGSTPSHTMLVFGANPPPASIPITAIAAQRAGILPCQSMKKTDHPDFFIELRTVMLARSSTSILRSLAGQGAPTAPFTPYPPGRGLCCTHHGG